MSLQFIVALVLSFVCLVTPARADVQAGSDAYDRGDYETAEKEYRKAAEEGNARAQFNLGVLYAKGQGVSQDYAQARQWYEKAAAQEYTYAQTNLGNLYLPGLGVLQNYKMALFWFRRAAEQGDPVALNNLAFMYENGRGVTQNFVEAHKWCTLLAATGDKHAAEQCDALAKQMTPSEIAEAQKLAREWKPKEK
jgi:TPR repeat protein